MAAVVVKDCVIDLNGQSVGSQSNEVTINSSRPVDELDAFNADAVDVGLGSQRHSVTIIGYHEKTANTLHDVASDMLEGNTAATLTIYANGKVAGNDFWTGTAYVESVATPFTKGTFAKTTVSLRVSGTFPKAIYSTP